MNYTIRDRTIAIAAAYQAVRLVQQIANKGIYNDHDFETCIRSIFSIDIEQAENAYGGSENLTTGFRTLLEQIGGDLDDSTVQKDMYITKYVIGAMVLEKQLRKNPEMLNTISSGIKQAKEQSLHFTITHENIIASLADLYTRTISQLKPRIIIHGEQVYLSNPKQANRIRALLLSTIRAIFLWRQCGGTRWQLIFQRRATIDMATMLLKQSV